MMRRREFIAGLAGAAACPVATRAQQPDRLRRIGVLMGNAESDDEGKAGVAAFRDELRKAGWTERRNVDIETRWAAPAIPQRPNASSTRADVDPIPAFCLDQGH